MLLGFGGSVLRASPIVTVFNYLVGDAIVGVWTMGFVQNKVSRIVASMTVAEIVFV